MDAGPDTSRLERYEYEVLGEIRALRAEVAGLREQLDGARPAGASDG